MVSDERDAILRRTKCMANHDMYLYRLNVDPPHDPAVLSGVRPQHQRARRAAAVVQRRVGQLHHQPLRARPRDAFRGTGDCCVNGSLDRLMYDRELLDQTLPFEELKKQSWVNEIANAAPVEGFGDHVRRELPGYRRQGNDGSERGRPWRPSPGEPSHTAGLEEFDRLADFFARVHDERALADDRLVDGLAGSSSSVAIVERLDEESAPSRVNCTRATASAALLAVNLHAAALDDKQRRVRRPGTGASPCRPRSAARPRRRSA